MSADFASLPGMETTTITLTEFQRSFKKARKRADAGFTVFIQGDGKRYIFEEEIPDTNPFAGLEHIFGPIRRLPKNKRNGNKAKKSHN